MLQALELFLFFPTELISLDLVIEPIKNSILPELGESCFDRLKDITNKIIETTGKGMIDLSVEAGNKGHIEERLQEMTRGERLPSPKQWFQRQGTDDTSS